MENGIQEILDKIDSDREWRKLELDNLDNILNRLSNEDEKNIIRKSIILMSYSHFEGFFKYSFIQYTGFLNEIKIPLGKAIDVLVVSTLNQAFTTYDDQKIKNTESKSDDIETIYQKILDNRITFVKRIDENRKNDIVNLAAEASAQSRGRRSPHPPAGRHTRKSLRQSVPGSGRFWSAAR